MHKPMPVKLKTAQATAKLLWENFIRHYGFPEKFLSDQGRHFESELISELCNWLRLRRFIQRLNIPWQMFSVKGSVPPFVIC